MEVYHNTSYPLNALEHLCGAQPCKDCSPREPQGHPKAQGPILKSAFAKRQEKTAGAEYVWLSLVPHKYSPQLGHHGGNQLTGSTWLTWQHFTHSSAKASSLNCVLVCILALQKCLHVSLQWVVLKMPFNVSPLVSIQYIHSKGFKLLPI